MQSNNPITALPPHLQKAINDTSIDLIDIMHGELKNLMYEYENKKFEDQGYGEGYQDALADLYSLTYELIFARLDINNQQRGNNA
jgi:hypothetical protein